MLFVLQIRLGVVLINCEEGATYQVEIDAPTWLDKLVTLVSQVRLSSGRVTMNSSTNNNFSLATQRENIDNNDERSAKRDSNMKQRHSR